MQANKSKLFIAGLIAANATKALNLGNDPAPPAPAALAQIQAASAVQAQLNVATSVNVEAADPQETEHERRIREAREKVQHIFKQILDGIETKREEALVWLCDVGDQLIDEVHDKADLLVRSLQTLADNRVEEMDTLADTIGATVDKALADAKAEISRLKAEAADAVTEKRKEVMYAIKDLKIEIGTTFKKGVKAEKKAQIESHVSELESFINKTIREYDDAVAHQIDSVAAATQAAWQALANEKDAAEKAFTGARDPAEHQLDSLIAKELLALDAAFDEKNDAAAEVHSYLKDNYARYLNELLSHVFEGASEAERDDLIGAALYIAPMSGDASLKDIFLEDVMDLNTQLVDAMTRKMAQVVKHINAVKSGKAKQHQHTRGGKIAEDEEGNPIVLQEEVSGYMGEVLDAREAMQVAFDKYLEEQKLQNSAAVKAVEEHDVASSDWLDDASRNELAILADFLEKGFAFHVETTDFISHTSHPYAPFSTGAYNELVDQINGFEQFFHYWKRSKERSIDTLATCKAAEKSNISTEVFEVDIPALEKLADDLLIAGNNAAVTSIQKGKQDLSTAKKNDTRARDLLERKVNKTKAKIFREIGFMVKKLYRATREEYKHKIKDELEDLITEFQKELVEAREELEGLHDTSRNVEGDKDDLANETFKDDWIEGTLLSFDMFDEETSPVTVAKLEEFRDVTMDAKIATARAEVDAGLTKKERDIRAAYEAVKLKISKIEDHHFQYNVRTLLEDAKAEADRRCAHEDHDTNAIVDGIETWVWDFVEESIDRYTAKVKAEREGLASGLGAAADRVWEESGEHQAILGEHHEHEKVALEHFLEDCVKGLKHLFNRYGYVSPQFEEKEHQHGLGYPHPHTTTSAENINAGKLVNDIEDQAERRKIEADKNKHESDLESWENRQSDCEGSECEEDESRSSCTGSSCDNPIIIDQGHHAPIQLDSLEDLAHVIDDEVIHREREHRHVEPTGSGEPREYEPFVDDDPESEEDLNPVKVAPVSPPEKPVISKYTPYVMPARQATSYSIDELPSFKNQFDLGFKKIIKTVDSKEEAAKGHPRPHGVDLHDTSAHHGADGHHNDPHASPVYQPALSPAPTEYYGTLAPAHKKPIKETPIDDIWGSYLAKWKKPEQTQYKKALQAEPWKPASYQPFDFGRYALRGRGPAVDDEPEAPRKAYWWEQPKAARAPGKQLAWWEQLTQGNAHLNEEPYVEPYVEPVVSKPAYKPYAPKQSYNSYTAPSYGQGQGGNYWWNKGK